MKIRTMINRMNITLALFLFLGSCHSYIKPTPKRYTYLNPVPSYRTYLRDSVTIIEKLNKMLANNIRPLSPVTAVNSAATTIHLDSILYSQDHKILVLFIITKTDQNKVEHFGNDTTSFLYNAYYLYALKDSLDKNIKLFDGSSIRFINFKSQASVKKALYEYCFGRRSTDRKWNGKEKMYNMDDIRFWEGKQVNYVRSSTSYIRL